MMADTFRINGEVSVTLLHDGKNKIRLEFTFESTEMATEAADGISDQLRADMLHIRFHDRVEAN